MIGDTPCLLLLYIHFHCINTLTYRRSAKLVHECLTAANTNNQYEREIEKYEKNIT